MAAACLWPPLGLPLQYDPCFKVDVRLREPIWKCNLNSADLSCKVAALASQLEALCRKELMERPFASITKGSVSNSFETKAMVILDKMEELINRETGLGVEEYMGYSRIGKLFPRAVTYINDPDNFCLQLQETDMDGYFNHVGALHQLLTIAHQINYDIINLTNHKYIAHQMALLYQSLTLFSESHTLHNHKKDIEQKFPIIKASLSKAGRTSDPPQLSAEHADWVLKVTKDIVDIVRTLPSKLSQPLLPAAEVLGKLT